MAVQIFASAAVYLSPTDFVVQSYSCPPIVTPQDELHRRPEVMQVC